MRTLRAKGEAGENVSFMWYSLRKEPSVILRCSRLREPRRMTVRCGSSFETRASALLRMTAALGRDDFLPLFAKSLDAERDHVADVEEFWRLHAGADARRCARGDAVAR